MNRYWSTYVQSSEELYQSRALRFREDNAEIWLSAMGITDDTDILEVGCGGGLFCHRIKSRLPNARVTGMDKDDGHIQYAKEKSQELGLDCDFCTGDAEALPFPDHRFDTTFSHTVMCFCEPDAFAREQYRVLKPGGRIVVMEVINSPRGPEPWVPIEGSEEKELFDRIWAEAAKNDTAHIRRYASGPKQYAEHLAAHGFREINANALATVSYAPGWANTSEELALAQIREEELSELCSVQKARALAPAALTEDEYRRLTQMIHDRFGLKIEQYLRGEQTWEYDVSTVFVVNAVKPAP